MTRRALAVLLVIAAAGAARAHQSSVKYVDLAVDGTEIAVRITVAPADVTEPLGLAIDAQPTVAAATVPAAARYVQAWLALGLADGSACSAGPPTAVPDPEVRFVVVAWRATCPAAPHRVRVDLARFFVVDARHEAIITLRAAGDEATRGEPQILRAGTPVATLALGQRASLAAWIADGLAHIYGGPDHIGFVLALLLVIVLVRSPDGAGWEVRRPLAALRSTAAIVTAFTVAHSLSLIAASLGYISLPSRLVESLIAASIVYTAVENVVRPDVRWRFALTFAFGLVHGLGFASMLAELLPPDHVVLPLLGFNLGVELGQLSIVAVALPLLLWVARRLGAARYRRVGLVVAGVPLAAAGLYWLVDRALGM